MIMIITSWFVNTQASICIPRMLSDEDDEGALDWLPMAPEIEDPEEPGWGQLEVSSCAMSYVC